MHAIELFLEKNGWFFPVVMAGKIVAVPASIIKLEYELQDVHFP